MELRLKSWVKQLLGIREKRFEGLSREDFDEIGELLESASHITSNQTFLDQWSRLEIQVQLIARWREGKEDDKEFVTHLSLLTSAFLSSDPRLRGYEAYQIAVQRMIK